MGTGGQDGLLGQGDLPWPSVVAARTYGRLDIGGIYSADDVSAAEFLIAELKSPDSELSADEAEEYALQLRALISKIESSAKLTKDQVLALKKKAESIPIVGPLLFGTANLPGTLASVGGLIHSASKATKVEDLLDMTDATRKQLKKWAASRGKPNSVSASRAMKGRLKLVRVGGNLYFEIPANTRASIYRLPGPAGGSHVHIPAFNTAKALRATAHVDGAAYGSRGVGLVLTGKAAGGALAFGPQAYLDWSSSTSVGDFATKSAYSQPTNALAFAAGLAIGTATAPAVVVITASILAGLAIQLVMSDDVTGWGTDLGNFLTGKD
ncbi:MAG TPA: hypothetical protein VES70_14975 [Pseudomonas sp.]|nr:hypothetical protein [Pseudomonas sp.]